MSGTDHSWLDLTTSNIQQESVPTSLPRGPSDEGILSTGVVLCSQVNLVYVRFTENYPAQRYLSIYLLPFIYFIAAVAAFITCGHLPPGFSVF